MNHMRNQTLSITFMRQDVELSRKIRTNATRQTFAYMTTTLICSYTADSDQNNTVSESDVDYDSDFCNDSDLDGYFRDSRN